MIFSKATASADASNRRWTTGTLVYTSAGLIALFGWLLFGEFAWQLKERSLNATTQLFLKRFAASDFLVGLLVGSVPAALGMLVAPIVSVRSDRHRGRWGRRIPFLLIPLPFVVVSMAGLAFSPKVGAYVHGALGADSPGLNTCVLGVFAAFWVVFEVASIVANTVFGAFVNDVVPRELIGRFFGLFRMVTVLDGIIFNYLLLEHAEEYFFWIYVGTGLFYGIGFTLMCLMVKEGKYPPVEEVAAVDRPGRWESLKTYFRECYTKPFYLWVFAAVVFCAMAFEPVHSFSIFYAKSLNVDLKVYGAYLAGSYVVSLVTSYYLGYMADRFHPLRVGMVVMGLYIPVTILGALFGTTAQSFCYAFLTHMIISGFYYAAMASIGQRLYPKMKFAQFASAAFLLQSGLRAILPPSVGAILDASGHNYRLTFVASGTLATIGLAALIVAHHKFMKLGGSKGYEAP